MSSYEAYNNNTYKDFNEKDNIGEEIIMREKKFRNFQRFILNIAIFLIILWLLFYFIIGLIHAPSVDMTPKIQSGDLLCYYKLNNAPNAGDVIIFNKNKTRYVARVIAKEGDTVQILKKGGVKVNVNYLVEEKKKKKTYPYKNVKYPLVLKKGQYFVLVDARETGIDSRYFGPVNKGEIEGVLAGIYRRTGF